MRTSQLSILTLTLSNFVIAIATKAHAYFQTVNDLIPFMHEYEKAVASLDGVNYADARKFRAYVQGAHDVTADDYDDTPKNLTSRQLLAVGVKCIKNNPEE